MDDRKSYLNISHISIKDDIDYENYLSNYINFDTLINKYLYREELCEEIDYYHKLGGDNWLSKYLETSIKTGIKSESIINRKKIFNFKVEKENSIKKILLRIINDLFLKILVASIFISTILNLILLSNVTYYYLQTIFMVISILIIIIFQFIIMYKQEKEYNNINSQWNNASNKILVIRDNVEQFVYFDDIVVGDIVKFSEGDIIPFYIVILNTTSELEILEYNHLKNTYYPIKKSNLYGCILRKRKVIKDKLRNINSVESNIILKNSKIIKGSITACVIKLNNNDKKMDISINNFNKDTKLQLYLNKLSKRISYFGFLFGIFLFIVLIIKLAINCYFSDSTCSINYIILEIVSYFIFFITTLIVIIPEGMPLNVALSIALMLKELLNNNIIVTKSGSCEKLGNTNVLCIDNIELFIENDIKLVKLWNYESYNLLDDNDEYINYRNIFNDEYRNNFEQCLIGIFDNYSINHKLIYRPTFDFISKNIRNYDFIKDNMNKYNSSNMRHLILLSYNKNIIYIFGNCKQMLEYASKIINVKTGNEDILTIDFKNKIKEYISDMSNQSILLYAFIYKNIKSINKYKSIDKKYKNFTLFFIFGYKINFKQHSIDAIRNIKESGIDLVFLTKHNKDFSNILLKKINLSEDKNINIINFNLVKKDIDDNSKRLMNIITNKDINTINSIENTNINYKKIEAINIYYNYDTKYKKKFFKLFTRKNRNIMLYSNDQIDMDNICLVTNYNSKVNVKQQADIILSNSCISSLLYGISAGRNMYYNIFKFIGFNITVSISSSVINLLSIIFYKQPIFNSLKLLWVNIIMDSMASLAFASEETICNLHKESKPIKNISNNKLLKHLFGQIIYQIIVINIILLISDTSTIESYANTELFIFNIFIFLQIFNIINYKLLYNIKNIKRSKILLLISFIITIIQVIIVNNLYFVINLYNTKLTVSQWIISILIGLSGTIINFILRFINGTKIAPIILENNINKIIKDYFSNKLKTQ